MITRDEEVVIERGNETSSVGMRNACVGVKGEERRKGDEDEDGDRERWR